MDEVGRGPLAGPVVTAAVILDPSRAGITPKALKRLLHLAPEHILYVSCNPKILARELPIFLDQYELRSLKAFDLFPHTRHVELLAGMQAIDA